MAANMDLQTSHGGRFTCRFDLECQLTLLSFPIAFQVVFGFVVLTFPYWLPESPRWLLTKDRADEATKVIAALRGLRVDDEETRLQVNIIVDSIRASGHKGGVTPFSALFTGGKTQHFRRMMLGASSQFFQQIGVCAPLLILVDVLLTLSPGLQCCHLLLPTSLQELDQRDAANVPAPGRR